MLLYLQLPGTFDDFDDFQGTSTLNDFDAFAVDETRKKKPLSLPIPSVVRHQQSEKSTPTSPGIYFVFLRIN